MTVHGGSIVKRRVAHLVVFVPAGLVLPAFLLLMAGCSSRSVETGMSSRPATTAVATPTRAATTQSAAAASHGHRPVRPIPDVIAKAKPFRMSQADGLRSNTDRAISTPASAPGSSGVETVSGIMPTQAALKAPIGPATGPDVAGINRLMRSYLQAFNRHDAAALAAHWTAAGENIDLDSGATTAGREAVQEVFAALFAQDAGAMIDIDIASIRPLRDDVAVIDGVSQIAFTDAPPSSSRFSAVAVRENGHWVLDSVRESTASSEHASAAAARQPASRPLDALAWLVGSWEDVSEGITASTHCFWSPNKAFLIRSHLVSAGTVPEQRPLPGDSRIPGLLPAGSTGSREITEIIGWDQDRGQIRSWIFCSNGQFAEGSWSQEGNTWTVRMDGQEAGGECVCTLTRMGADELTCRCGSDRCVDVMPPACDFVRTARAAAQQ